MAFQNKRLDNVKTGQRIHFLQTSRDTNGRLLEMEATYRSGSVEPVEHYHPYQEEDFTVLSGELMVRIDGQLQLLRPGDTLHIPKNKVHAMWNASPTETIVNWQVRPALNTEHLLETMTGLANDGKTNETGMPGIWQIALTASRYAPVLRLSRPPFVIQKILFTLLTPVAYLLGYRPTYWATDLPTVTIWINASCHYASNRTRPTLCRWVFFFLYLYYYQPLSKAQRQRKRLLGNGPIKTRRDFRSIAVGFS